MTQFYAGPDLQVELQVLLRPANISQARLGETRLAWTGWLRRTPAAQPDDQVHVRLRNRLPAAQGTTA